MNKKIILACSLLSLTANIFSMEDPLGEAMDIDRQPEENIECSFSSLPDEIMLYLFGFVVNQPTAKDRFEQIGRLLLACRSWSALATDESFLRSIVPKDTDKEFTALGEKLANYINKPR